MPWALSKENFTTTCRMPTNQVSLLLPPLPHKLCKGTQTSGQGAVDQLGRQQCPLGTTQGGWAALTGRASRGGELQVVG